MAKLPNNYIEILTYLRDCHPDGMTTGEILALAKKNRYYEFNNSTQVSSCIFYMRAKKLASSLDAASAESRVFMIPIILDFTLFHRGYLLLAK